MQSNRPNIGSSRLIIMNQIMLFKFNNFRKYLNVFYILYIKNKNTKYHSSKYKIKIYVLFSSIPSPTYTTI